MEQDTASTLREEQLVSAILVIAGLAALFTAFREGSGIGFGIEPILETLLFAGVVVIADQFPIHLSRGMKASLTNVPIYLGAVLLPASLAVLVAGVGILTAELRAKKLRGLLPRDIAATTGQWLVITYIGSRVIHSDLPWLPDSSAKYAGLLFGVIAFLFLDVFFFAISSSFILQQPLFHTLRSSMRESLAMEGVQYALAFLGTLAVMENRWFLLFLLIPGISIYILFKNTKEVKEDTLHLLEDMADIVDLRDVYTGGHSKRVAGLVDSILNHMNILGQEAEIIVAAARLHDIGKIGIPDDVLKKPGRLTPQEMLVMQTHPDLGADLISKYKTFSRGVAMIRHHHEHWDGRGYPAGLKGHEIPFGARVIAVADSFDAMTSDRPYRKALSARHAIQILLDGRGSQWDSSVVTSFVELMGENPGDEPEKAAQEQLDHQIIPQSTLLP